MRLRTHMPPSTTGTLARSTGCWAGSFNSCLSLGQWLTNGGCLPLPGSPRILGEPRISPVWAQRHRAMVLPIGICLEGNRQRCE